MLLLLYLHTAYIIIFHWKNWIRDLFSILDPYKDHIDRWLLNGPIFARTIHDRLIECGCKCGYTIVNDYVRLKILEYEESGIYKVYKSKLRDQKPRLEKILEEKQKLGEIVK